MKRLLFFFLGIMIPMTALSACGEPPELNTDFTAEFSAVHNGTEYCGRLSAGRGRLSILMTAPYTVSGLGFDYDGSRLNMSLGGLNAAVNSGYLPSAAVPEALHNTLAYLDQAAYSGTEDSQDVYTLPSPYGDAKLTAVNGYPLSLYDPHTGMTFCFSQSRSADD